MVGYVAPAGVPLLTVPSLGGGDAMDDTSIHFLLEMALLSPEEVEQLRKAEKRKLAREEKERKEKELQEVFGGPRSTCRGSPSPHPPRLRGKGKRGRRRRSFRSHVFFLAGRLLRGAEAVPHGRPGFGLRFPGTMWRSTSCCASSGSPRLSSSSAVTFSLLVLLVTLHLALYFLFLSSGPRCSASRPV